jgi:tyrosine-protein kinase Etk/Wzc
MSDDKETAGLPDGQMKRVSIVQYLVVVARNKRFIVRFSLAAIVIAAILLYLIIPRWYKSTAVVMLPKQKMGISMLTSLARATAPLRGLGLGQASEDLSNLKAILGSRRVMTTIIDRFNLRAVYDVDTLEKAIEKLDDNTDVADGKEDVSIEVTVYDTDPHRAADIANAYIDELNKVYTELNVTEARSNRLFIEQRYLQNVRDLEAAEDSMQAFQERYGIFSVTEQLKAVMETAATLESRIALKEVQAGVLRRSVTEDNPALQAVEQEIAELRKQVNTLRVGGDKHASLVFPPLATAPALGVKYLRIYREAEVQAKIMELVLPLYEQAKIEEQRDTPSVLVLDTATPAFKASKPKRMFIMLAVMLFAPFLAYLIAVTRDSMKHSREVRTASEEESFALIRRELSLKNIFR